MREILLDAQQYLDGAIEAATHGEIQSPRQMAPLAVAVMTQAARLCDDIGTSYQEDGVVKAMLLGGKSYDLFGIPDERASAYRTLAEEPGRKMTGRELAERLPAGLDPEKVKPGYLNRAIHHMKAPDHILRDVYRWEGRNRNKVAWLELPAVEEGTESVEVWELGSHESNLAVTAYDLLRLRAHLPVEGLPDDGIETLARASRLYRLLGEWGVPRGSVNLLLVDEEPCDMTFLDAAERNVLWVMADHPSELHPAETWAPFMHTSSQVRKFQELMQGVVDPSHPARRVAAVVVIEASESDEPRYGIKGSNEAPEFSRVPPLPRPRAQKQTVAGRGPKPVRAPDAQSKTKKASRTRTRTETHPREINRAEEDRRLEIRRARRARVLGRTEGEEEPKKDSTK